MKRLIVVLYLVCMAVSALSAQAPVTSLRDTLKHRFASQLELYPQEKIHLHVDRNYYVPGERIWFKAYVADASTNQYLADSRYVYVELINAADTVVNRVMLRVEEEMYHGNIFLSEQIPEGYYTLRAYTRYMENPEEDYFFRKHIRIGSLAADKTATTPKQPPRSVREDYTVSFFPEGGNLLVGTLCRVGFKALNTKGYSEYVSGTIKDNKGEFVASAEVFHAGMGSFAFLPEKGKSYYLHCTNGNGLAKQFKLPEAQEQAYALSANWHGSELRISRQHAAGMTNIPLQYLLIHCRGNVLHFTACDPEQRLYPFTEIPSGVIQILLLDSDLNPISERLVFSKGKDQATVTVEMNKENYKVRDHVTVRLQLADENNIPLTGDLSVAVTDDRDLSVDQSATITSSLLLSSELKGYIESPGFYFEADDDFRQLALDKLMLTQGWRRYDVAQVIKGNPEIPSRTFERYKSITGTVKQRILNKPVVNGFVSMIPFSGGTALLEQTDEEGRFLFDELEYQEGVKLLFSSQNDAGKDDVRLLMDKEEFLSAKALAYEPDPYIPVKKEESVPEELFMEKAQERSKYNEDMRTVNLETIEVVGQRNYTQQKGRATFSQFAIAAVGKERIEAIRPKNIPDLLRGVAGVDVSFEGAIRIQGDLRPPAIVVDEIPFFDTVFSDSTSLELEAIDPPLLRINVDDVESVEVFYGATTVMYGLAGSHGVVKITTKKGSDLTNGGSEMFNRALLSPLGFQSPVEFYSPVYETEQQKFDITPDLRSTIYWKPDLITSDEGDVSFDFYTADYTTTYSIVIEGLTDDGKPVRHVEKLKIE